MKATGIARKIDSLGRVVIPREIRKSLNIVEDETVMEIFVEGEQIVLKKYKPGCYCCNNMNGLIEILGIKLCPSCIDEFNKSRQLIDEIRNNE